MYHSNIRKLVTKTTLIYTVTRAGHLLKPIWIWFFYPIKTSLLKNLIDSKKCILLEAVVVYNNNNNQQQLAVI